MMMLPNELHEDFMIRELREKVEKISLNLQDLESKKDIILTHKSDLNAKKDSIPQNEMMSICAHSPAAVCNHENAQKALRNQQRENERVRLDKEIARKADELSTVQNQMKEYYSELQLQEQRLSFLSAQENQKNGQENEVATERVISQIEELHREDVQVNPEYEM